MNTVNNSRRKRWLAAGFFLAILLLTIGPLTLLRSPAPAGYVNDIAVCEPEYNPGPAGIAQAEKNESYLEESDSLIQLLANSDDSDVSIFNSMGGLLTYDLNLARFWMDAIVESGEQGAVSATVAEARRRSSDSSYQPCVIR